LNANFNVSMKMQNIICGVIILLLDISFNFHNVKGMYTIYVNLNIYRHFNASDSFMSILFYNKKINNERSRFFFNPSTHVIVNFL
jgi:hypothetical protein